MFSGGYIATGSQVGTLDLTLVATAFWEDWSDYSKPEKHPSAEPWRNYVPELSVYLIGSGSFLWKALGSDNPGERIGRPIFGWDNEGLATVFSKRSVKNPFETKNCLTLAYILVYCLLATPLVFFVARVFASHYSWRFTISSSPPFVTRPKSGM